MVPCPCGSHVFIFSELKKRLLLPPIDRGFPLMMMIAFMTIHSGFVPLIEGLCAPIDYLRFEIIGGLRSHLLLFSFGSKNMLKKKAVSPRSHPSPSINIHMCTLYTYTNIYMPRFSPSGFFGPSSCFNYEKGSEGSSVIHPSP